MKLKISLIKYGIENKARNNRMTRIKVPSRVTSKEDTSEFNIRIKRKNKENLPHVRNIGSPYSKSHLKLPRRKLTTHHIRDLIMPAPIVAQDRSKTRNLFNNQASNSRLTKKKRSSYFKKRGFRSQVRLPKPKKEKLNLKIDKPSLHDVSNVLEVFVRSSNSPNTSAKTSSKERGESETKLQHSKNSK